MQKASNASLAFENMPIQVLFFTTGRSNNLCRKGRISRGRIKNVKIHKRKWIFINLGCQFKEYFF